MAKWAAGCLVVVVIALSAAVAAMYFGYRAFGPMIDDAQAVVQQAKEAAAQGERLENKTTYTPPADGELTEAQVGRFLAVHERTRLALGPRWAELRAQADRLAAQARQDARELSFAEMANLVRGLGSIIVEARRAHVDAMNAEQFSSSEYTWVKLRAYEAAGLEVLDGIDWSAVEEAVKEGASRVGVAEPTMPKADVPARNRELVKPHIDRLKEWLPLTVLGF
jgi:hypothetical protein